MKEKQISKIGGLSKMAKQKRIIVVRKIDITSYTEEEQKRYRTKIDAALLIVKDKMEDIRDKRLRREERQQERELARKMEQENAEGVAKRRQEIKARENLKDQASFEGRKPEAIKREKEKKQTMEKEEQKEQETMERLQKSTGKKLIVDKDSEFSDPKPTID